jgi:F-type H+-transporting ATPase subunit gamma
MAQEQDLKRRIRSVKNTMQLTRAMKMVSAAKLRRAQDRVFAARPYAERMHTVLQSLAARANPEDHPLLAERGDRRVAVVVVSSDKGLCGSFNAAVCRLAHRQIVEHEDGHEVTVTPVGKKARDYFRARHYDLVGEQINRLRIVEFSLAKEIAGELMRRFLENEVDMVFLVYNEFKSAISQKPRVEQLLPIERAAIEGGETLEDYIYEPNAVALFERLMPHHIEIQVFRALLETIAAEHAARMTAMESATKNAGELIDSLTLTMNRIRQASITTEIIEVVSGAEALG